MKYLCITLLLFLTINCFAQKTTVYNNKDYTPRSYSKVLVITESHQADINDKIVKDFSKIGMVALTSMELLPPIKEYTEDDVKKICADNSIDGIIKVENTETGRGIGVVLSTEKRYHYKVTFSDITNNVIAATIIGNSLAGSYDRAVLRFFREIMPDIQKLIK